MTIRNPICSVLNRWIDETSRANDAAGHDYYERKRAVQALGRIHHCVWREGLHKKMNITAGDCFWLVFIYGAEIALDILAAPFKIVVCKR